MDCLTKALLRARILEKPAPPHLTVRVNRTTVEASPPELLGVLKKKDIDDEIRSHIGSAKRCYQARLREAPAESGVVVIKFVIDTDGSVRSAEVKNTTLHESVGSCIVEVFRGMQFPEPKEGGIVIVSYPLAFNPA